VATQNALGIFYGTIGRKDFYVNGIMTAKCDIPARKSVLKGLQHL
jgi:hypothetical protein